MRIPMMGVMGAFVFAAQMINFPVGPGTSGHLVGGALLAMTLGPAAAILVMTAILGVQALIFQDGGILALGANILNMGVAGVLAGYLPYHYWGRGNYRRAAIFAGGFLSVFTAACLALSQLLISGVKMPGAVLGASLLLFAVSSAAEGAITAAATGALERLNATWLQKPEGKSSALGMVFLFALILASVGALFASALPDGLERLTEQLGISENVTSILHGPLADYDAHWLKQEWMRRTLPGVLGIAAVYVLCLAAGHIVARRGHPAAQG